MTNLRPRVSSSKLPNPLLRSKVKTHCDITSIPLQTGSQNRASRLRRKNCLRGLPAPLAKRYALSGGFLLHPL